MASMDEKRLVAAFVKFLRDKVQSTTDSNSSLNRGSLEVAVECLESGFGINANDSTLMTDAPLLTIFTQSAPAYKEPSEGDKQTAEHLKNEGNDLMKEGKCDDAIRKYTAAIQLHRNPVFYCNRAAAYSKLERHDDALADCKTALQLDPNYSKAYGRMGLAYTCLNRFREASDAYRKALELDPNNESFKNNLAIAEMKLREEETNETTRASEGMPGGMPGMNPFGLDLGNLMNNPALMNIASQMMTDPNMQNFMNSFMSNQGGGAPNVDNLLQVGQRLASQLQQQNPDLVENLRRQFQQQHGPNSDKPDDSKPPNQPQPPPS